MASEADLRPDDAKRYGHKKEFVPVHKAVTLGQPGSIESLSIEITVELPRLPTRRMKSMLGVAVSAPPTLDDEVFQKDAEAIVNALGRALPGGTFDRVFIEMARRKASELIVPASKYWVEGNGSIRGS